MIKPFDVANVIMNVVLFSAFIGIFFFTYGSYLEKQVFKSQIDYLLDDLLGSVKTFVPELSNLKPAIDNIQIPDMSEIDKKVKENNKQVKMKAAKAIIALVIVGLLSVGLIGYYGKHGDVSKTKFFKTLLIYDSIALLFVGLTEFVFATQFVVKFMALDVNHVKKQVIDKLIELRNK